MKTIIIQTITLIVSIHLACNNNSSNRTDNSQTLKDENIYKNHDRIPSDFLVLLDRTGMKFIEPTGLKQTDPIENRQMNWELAYKHPNKRFEVRYAIRPMDVQLMEYKEFESNKKEGEIYFHPNKSYKSVFEAAVLNVSGGQLPDYAVFEKEDVRKEFNADWGATVGVTAGKEFGQTYKYCLIVFIHKDNWGEGYIFYLYDDRDLLNDEMMPIFHCLKFK